MHSLPSNSIPSGVAASTRVPLGATPALLESFAVSTHVTGTGDLAFGNLMEQLSDETHDVAIAEPLTSAENEQYGTPIPLPPDILVPTFDAQPSVPNVELKLEIVAATDETESLDTQLETASELVIDDVDLSGEVVDIAEVHPAHVDIEPLPAPIPLAEVEHDDSIDQTSESPETFAVDVDDAAPLTRVLGNAFERDSPQIEDGKRLTVASAINSQSDNPIAETPTNIERVTIDAGKPKTVETNVEYRVKHVADAAQPTADETSQLPPQRPNRSDVIHLPEPAARVRVPSASDAAPTPRDYNAEPARPVEISNAVEPDASVSVVRLPEERTLQHVVVPREPVNPVEAKLPSESTPNVADESLPAPAVDAQSPPPPRTTTTSSEAGGEIRVPEFGATNTQEVDVLRTLPSRDSSRDEVAHRMSNEPVIDVAEGALTNRSPSTIHTTATSEQRNEIALPSANPATIEREAPRVPTPNTEQIIDAAKLSHERVNGRITRSVVEIQLDPPDLGIVVVQVEKTLRGLTAHVSAVEEGALPMLQQDQHVIVNALSDLGIEFTGFSLAEESTNDQKHERQESEAGKLPVDQEVEQTPDTVSTRDTLVNLLA